MHNSIPEYRIEWFKKLSCLSSIKFVFTNESLVKKIYKYNIDYNRIKDLDYVIIEKGIKGLNSFFKILNEIKYYDFVELPAVDSFNEYWKSFFILLQCKRLRIPMGYFWEKWESPIAKQPIKRKIKNFILGTAAKSIYRHADIIFAGGSRSKEYFLKKGIKSSKIFVLPNTSETPLTEYINLKEKYNISYEKKIILYFGRIMKEKGLDVLLKAYALLDEQSKKESFILVAGDGKYKSECEDIANRLMIRNIKFVGMVSPNKRRNFFEQCDVFVFPGTFYNGCVDVWGLTINEAIQHGKIVISTNAVGSAIDLVENDVNGYIVEAENIEELKKALFKVLNSKEIIDRAIRKDKELMKIYSFENMANSYINIIKKMINKE